MQIGLFFGSFDPVHIGHLAIANYLREFTDVQEVWFVLSPQSPFKTHRQLSPEQDRKRMLELALQQAKAYQVCDIELNLPRPSFTYRTLQTLRQNFPQHSFVLLIGGDNLPTFPQWKQAHYIVQNFEIYVYPRRGFEAEKLTTLLRQEPFFAQGKVKIIHAPLIEISATFIRENIAKGKDLRFFLHPAVYQYILEQKLYLPSS